MFEIYNYFLKGGSTVDKNYYEAKLREILDRDEKSEAEFLQTMIDLISLNYQYQMNK